MTKRQVTMSAVQLKAGLWAVRPEGALGTCGFWPNPWDIQLVKARDAREAINRAKPMYYPTSTQNR